jgi:GDP-D-mannose dehydratase
MGDDTVLVTEVTGFPGAYCNLALMAAGYGVRTTIRNL